MKPILLFSFLAFLVSSCGKKQSTMVAAPTAASTAIPYPLDVCIVAGEKLGGMGEPVVIVHDGQEVKFCCDSCLPKFEKDPAKYLSKLEPKP